MGYKLIRFRLNEFQMETLIYFLFILLLLMTFCSILSCYTQFRFSFIKMISYHFPLPHLLLKFIQTYLPYQVLREPELSHLPC